MKTFEEKLRTFNGTISRETESLQKLIYLKSGLMSDLLTGAVRVPEESAVA